MKPDNWKRRNASTLAMAAPAKQLAALGGGSSGALACVLRSATMRTLAARSARLRRTRRRKAAKAMVKRTPIAFNATSDAVLRSTAAVYA